MPCLAASEGPCARPLPAWRGRPCPRGWLRLGIVAHLSASTDIVAPASSGVERLSVLDLFAGAGGISAGLDRTGGFLALEAVEMDVAAAATYAANHDGAVYVGPIQDWLRSNRVPSVDVIVGGPPCQGFSALGKQDAEDERNVLWREYAATITRAQPRWFVVENVATFLASGQFQEFAASTRPGCTLADYRIEARVLNAADYGAYQARKRAVVVGHHRDLPFPGWPRAEFTGKHRTVRQALAGVPSSWDAVELPERVTEYAGVTLPGVYRTTELHIGRNYTPLSVQRFAHIPPEGNRFDLPEHLLAPCWVKHRSGSADVMGRLRWDRPSVTIRTEFFKPEKGRYLHPEANRAITHYEAALLQGFSRDYRWVGSKTAIARQIGNAVPIPLAEAIGMQLLRAAGLRD